MVWLLLVIAAGLACASGPSEVEVQRIVDARVATAVASIPTVTPVPITPTATPQPTPTLVPVPDTPIPAPTATPTPRAVPQSATTGVDFNSVYLQAAPSVFLLETFLGSGTGWLVGTGSILTNAHVVAGSTTVLVKQPEGGSFFATVVGRDSVLDVALLEFDDGNVDLFGKGYVSPLGDISTWDIAKPVLAIGYSGGRRTDSKAGVPSANVGVLSSIEGFGTFDNLIIDAPVDPGDSGGPILNSDGQIVGMVRAAQVSTGSGQRVVGTFLAVPVYEIRAVLPTLKLRVSR